MNMPPSIQVCPHLCASAGTPACIPRNWEWAEFWAQVQDHLRQSGYRKGSRRLYRNVLRGFRAHCGCRPSEVTRGHIRDYLRHLGTRQLSSSWIGMNLSVLRLVFDRIYEQQLTGHLPGPRRPKRLPEILSPGTIAMLLDHAESRRDRLLVGLLYGCGLKVGEVCRLQWEDVDLDDLNIQVRNPTTGIVRALRLPRELVPILHKTARSRRAGSYVFRGQKPGSHLSIRMAEHAVSSLARRAIPGTHVTSFSLRHAYAVHSLEAGMNVRELQQALGHTHLNTTVRYLRLLLPEGIISPLDRSEFSVTCTEQRPGPMSNPPGQDVSDEGRGLERSETPTGLEPGDALAPSRPARRPRHRLSRWIGLRQRPS